MVPLVMSSSSSSTRDDNVNNTFEEFATHLSLYDDSFHFVEKSLPTMMDIKGSLPPSVFCPVSKNTADLTEQVKVKRKCGRPRNPIPRHKRESHINAEHRRRGKIQDGFRTLKNIVPKYEQTSGRDSKADILFKAVDYCKLLQNDMKDLCSSMEALRAEKDLLSVHIKNYKALVPDMTVYDDLSISIDDRYDEYVLLKTKESWTFGTFKAIMHPLFESYKSSVRGESMEDFLCSVADWAASSLSVSNLTTVCLTVLRSTHKQEFKSTSSYTDADSNNFRSSNYLTYQPTSDKNIGHFPSTQVLTSEHFGYRDDAENVDSSNGAIGTVPAEVYANTFDSSRPMSNKNSPMTKGGAHMNTPYHQDLDPYGAGHLYSNSGIFCDLYYNLDYGQHHHLNLARTGIDGRDTWPHLYFRQQQWHSYQNNQFPPSNHFHDLKKGHPLWDNHHQQVSHSLAAELMSGPSLYNQQSNSVSHRDFSCDLASPRQTQDMQSTTVGYLSHPTNIVEYKHERHKRSSQSSSESEGSMLNMETFAKTATEMLVDHDKYGQLSPSTDSCISPDGSSSTTTFVPSPCVLGGRSSDHTVSYHNCTSSIDQLQQYKGKPHERIDSLESQGVMSLPSYRDTFGNRPNQQYRHPVTRFHGGAAVRSHWGLNTSINKLSTGSRRESSERLEPSTNLAEMLDQKSPLLHAKSPYDCEENMTWPPPDSNKSVSPSKTVLVKSLIADSITYDLINRSPNHVKHDSDYRLTSFTTQPDTLNTCSSVRYLTSPSPKNIQENLDSNPQSTVSQTKYSPAQTDWEASHPGVSTWLQQDPILHSCHDVSVNRKTQPCHDDDEVRKHVCYFEMAHQQLLRHHSMSVNNNIIRELKSPDVIDSHRLASRHSSLHQIHVTTSKTSQSSTTILTPPSTVVRENSVMLDELKHQLPIPTCQLPIEEASKQKIRRKNSFEDEYQGEKMSQSVSGGYKKTCVRKVIEKTCKKKSSRSETIKRNVEKQVRTDMQLL